LLRLALVASACGLTAAALPRAGWAHAQPYSFLDLHLEADHLRGSLTAHVFDLAHEVGLASPDSLFESAVAERYADTLIAVLGTRLRLTADHTRVVPRWARPTPVPERTGLRFDFQASWRRLPATLEIEGPLFPYDPQHQTYLNVYEHGRLRHQDLLDASRSVSTHYTGTRQGVMAVVRSFVAAGIHHIFIGPDHILFVVGLLLLGGGMARLLKIVTAFTLAHSLTLALATLEIVNPPARLIEPAIALSIVCVGLDNLRAHAGRADRRAWIAFGFGFVHGFGFASVLREFGLPREALGWSLFAFNVGVEVGQACIVGAIAPLLAWVSRASQPSGKRIAFAGSCAVALAGTYWFIERALAFSR
jgi:hydrogenase/urease accessory protein HupE